LTFGRAGDGFGEVLESAFTAESNTYQFGEDTLVESLFRFPACLKVLLVNTYGAATHLVVLLQTLPVCVKFGETRFTDLANTRSMSTNEKRALTLQPHNA
jgi:hypothetical protein